MTIDDFLLRVAEYWVVLSATRPRNRLTLNPELQNVPYVLVALWENRKAIAEGKRKALKYSPERNALQIESIALRTILAETGITRPFKVFYKLGAFAAGIKSFAGSPAHDQWQQGHVPDLTDVAQLVAFFEKREIPIEKNPPFVGTLVQGPVADGVTAIAFKGLTADDTLKLGETRKQDARARTSRRIAPTPHEQPPTWVIAADDRYHFDASINTFPEGFTPMMRDLMRERFNATPDGDTDRFTARLGDEEGQWLATYLPPATDVGSWSQTARAALLNAQPDFVLAVTAQPYDDARSAIATVAEGLPPLRILDADQALAWCGPVPWVWSKHYGTTSSAHVIKPGDEEHLRRVLGAKETSGVAAWDGATSRRIIASSSKTLGDQVLGVLQPYAARVIIVLHQGIGQDVLRLAQGFGDILARNGHEEFIVVLLDPPPGQAEHKAGLLLDVMRWITERTPSARVHGLIAQTSAPSFEALQPWLQDHGFSTPLTI